MADKMAANGPDGTRFHSGNEEIQLLDIFRIPKK